MSRGTGVLPSRRTRKSSLLVPTAVCAPLKVPLCKPKEVFLSPGTEIIRVRTTYSHIASTLGMSGDQVEVGHMTKVR